MSVLNDLFVGGAVGRIDRSDDVIGLPANLNVSVREDVRKFLTFCVEKTHHKNSIRIDITYLLDVLQTIEDCLSAFVRAGFEGVESEAMVSVDRFAQVSHLRVVQVLNDPVAVAVAADRLPPRTARLLCIVYDGHGLLKVWCATEFAE